MEVFNWSCGEYYNFNCHIRTTYWENMKNDEVIAGLILITLLALAVYMMVGLFGIWITSMEFIGL